MQRLASLFLAATAALLLPSLAAAADTEASDAALAAQVPQWMRQAKVPGAAIAHVRDGRTVALHAFGESAPGVPLQPDTVFNVASLTKPVFATMVLGLQAEGRLALDMPLAEHWVDPDVAGDPRHRALTPRLALSHQSGLPNWRSGKLAFDFAPGARHEYSGEGFEYTRRAIERLTGQAMPELMQRHVLAPAGMEHTQFGWTDALASKVATGFEEDGSAMDMDYLRQRGPNAAANMFTTIGDYARFTRWVIDGAGLPPAVFEEMSRPQARHADPVEFFGIGWRLLAIDGGTVLSHDGRESGVRTQVFAVPHAREGVVILTNSSHGELIVRPVVEATLRDGAAIMDKVARDTWHWLLRLPAEQIGPMQEGISRSPSFMSKLLYAAHAGLVEDAGVDEKARSAARRAIDPLVFAMVEGRVAQPRAKALIATLVDAESGHLHRRFTRQQAQAWSAALHAAVAAE